ncbi:MAG: hypothetical protein II304_02005 [Bacteroidales bacterium]|nr:hypothetical protein [Bacteroidales bacterium]
MMEKKWFTVYSQRLAGHLMQCGFPLLKLKSNSHNRRNCFIFSNSDALQDAIGKWQLKRLEEKENMNE